METNFHSIAVLNDSLMNLLDNIQKSIQLEPAEKHSYAVAKGFEFNGCDGCNNLCAYGCQGTCEGACSAF